MSAYLAVAMVILCLTGWEWFRWWSHSPPQPIVVTVVAFGAMIFCTIRITQARREIRNLAQAERGERRVSEVLREQRGKNYITFDDLVTGHGNVDHVVVGPGGVFAIETKAYSVFGNGRASVREDGVLMLADKEAMDDPLRQARGSAAAIAEDLERYLHRKIWVEPVLILPGWKVASVIYGSAVAVLNDRDIPEFFNSRPPKLSNAEIREISSHLDRSARS